MLGFSSTERTNAFGGGFKDRQSYDRTPRRKIRPGSEPEGAREEAQLKHVHIPNGVESVRLLAASTLAVATSPAAPSPEGTCHKIPGDEQKNVL